MNTDEEKKYLNVELNAVLVLRGKIKDFVDLCDEIRKQNKLSIIYQTMNACNLYVLKDDELTDKQKEKFKTKKVKTDE